MKEKFNFFKKAQSYLNVYLIKNKEDFELDFEVKVEDVELVNYKYGRVLHDNFREGEYYFVEILLGTDGNSGSIGKYLLLLNENFEYIEDAFI